MKIYKFCSIIFFALFLFSCDKETENLSRPTYYVAFEILGDNPAIVQVGEPYVDAGAIATIRGNNVSNMDIVSNVVYDEMGLYKVEYSSTNADGLKSRAIRDVIVCNPSVTTDLSGTWDVNRDGTSFWASGALNRYYGGPGYTVTISRVAPGFFFISDYLAGFWNVNQGRGPIAVIFGYFALNEDKSIDALSSNSNYFAPDLLNFKDGLYDDSDGNVNSITYETGAALNPAYTYKVKLTKNK